MQGVILLGVAGLPVSCLLSWFYDFERDGILRTPEQSSAPAAATSWSTPSLWLALAAGALFAFRSLQAWQVFVAPAERPGIAVLPFHSLSADPEQAFYADHLAEDLITRLSTWHAFPVIARNSSCHYRDGNVDLQRFSAQLIDATSGEHVWAETFDRDVKDVFAVQDEISATITASMVDDMAHAEAERSRARGTDELEAWSLYQIGMKHYDQFRARSMPRPARGSRAVALDPRYATALGRLTLTERLPTWREDGSCKDSM